MNAWTIIIIPVVVIVVAIIGYFGYIYTTRSPVVTRVTPAIVQPIPVVIPPPIVQPIPVVTPPPIVQPTPVPLVTVTPPPVAQAVPVQTPPMQIVTPAPVTPDQMTESNSIPIRTTTKKPKKNILRGIMSHLPFHPSLNTKSTAPVAVTGKTVPLPPGKQNAVTLDNVTIQAHAGGFTMAPDPTKTHGNVIKVTWNSKTGVMTPHGAGPRTEIMTKYGMTPNKLYTISFDFMNMTENSNTTFCQVLDSPKSLTVDRLKMGMSSKGTYTLALRQSATDQSVEKMYTMTAAGPVAADNGKWNNWRIDYMRTSSNTGYVEVYKNGTLVQSVHGIPTMYSEKLLSQPDAHAKFGQYKHASNATNIEYYTNIVIIERS